MTLGRAVLAVVALLPVVAAGEPPYGPAASAAPDEPERPDAGPADSPTERGAGEAPPGAASGRGPSAGKAEPPLPHEPEEPEEPREPPKPPEPIETINLEDPAFPTPRLRDSVRLRLESRFLPAGTFDAFDVDLYRPALRLRATMPLSRRSVLQLTGRLSSNLYDFDRDADLGVIGASDSFADFYNAALTLQGGFRLNESWSFFSEGEIWSLLASATARSRWQGGAFVEGLTGSGVLALGYEIENRIRIAIGLKMGSRLDRDGVGLQPVASFKWDVTPRFRIRNRGQGVQVEYTFGRQIEGFLTSVLDNDQFLIDSTRGLPDDITFRDRMVLAGLGFEWRISRHFRASLEGGAVAWREIRVKSRQQGTLFQERSDPGGYLDLRFELRP